eukprot:c7224_g1_i2.p1 GENE.c7224_g1_i2~~c7224_g1_i2.p1  ORF type:complete len:109 (-),score=8.86 c7224_g1_i2:61-387(-)
MDRTIVSDLLHAFDLTLNAEPYPPGSRFFGTPWKIALGISNVCRNETNRSYCRELKLAPLLHKGLSIALETGDSRLIRYSLLSLWRLTDGADSREFNVFDYSRNEQFT